MRRAILTTGLATLLLVAGSLFVTATYGSGGLAAPPVRVEAVPAEQRARIRLVDGIPVARLRGSHYNIGFQHGTIFRDQILFLRREYFEALQVPMVGRERLREWARQVEPHIPASLKEELHGLADGAGGTYEDALLSNVAVDLMQAMMCSTVVAAPEATADGEVYFGRNLDFPGRGILQRTSVILVFEAEGATPVAAVTWPGLVGILSGMNAEGVCGATMMIHRAGDTQPGLPYMMMYREALARARKTADVHDFIAASRRTCPNNFMVVDATGAAEVTEFTADAAVRRTGEHGCLCSTNFFRSESLRDAGWDLGVNRYRDLERFLEENRGKIDLPGVIGALREVARPWFLNVQSMVFLPRQRALHLAAAAELPAANARFVRIDREALFGAEGK